MEKRQQLKTVICGVALVALASVPVASAQTNPCTSGGFSGGVCNKFDADHLTNKYQFGDHFIKFTVAGVNNDFELNVEFRPITDSELDDRVIPPLREVNCIKYVGATSDTNLGTCGFYHVTNPPDAGDYSGPVTVRIFWDFPSLAILHNVRLYRAPFDGVNQTCTDGPPACYNQDITDAVFAVGDHNSDPGVKGTGNGFSDFEAVDLTSPTSAAARVWIGLKNSGDAGIRFDLKADVKKIKKNWPPSLVLVSSGELLGADGGSSNGFSNATLRTIPLSLPASAFASRDIIILELFVRNSCVGSNKNSGTARLWFNDAAANSRVDEPGTGTRYLRLPFFLDGPGSGPRISTDVSVRGPDSSCNGRWVPFGIWAGLVP